MPGIDGLEFARRLISQPLVSRAPIIILSSLGRELNPASCAELGISIYLTKPGVSSVLFDAINRVVRVPAESVFTGTKTRRDDAVPRILVADDDFNNRILVTNILKRNAYEVVIARDGKEAVDLFSRGAADLILMDMQMPNLSGLEATAAIRDLESGSARRIPIVALTAHAMAGDQERCLAAGMDDYLSKPVRTNDLLAKLAQFTAQRDR